MTTAHTRPQPDGCWCVDGKPTTIAHFANQQLVAVEHQHRAYCGLPTTTTPPADYQAGIRARAPRGGRR